MSQGTGHDVLQVVDEDITVNRTIIGGAGIFTGRRHEKIWIRLNSEGIRKIFTY
jgi:hypothetical protein